MAIEGSIFSGQVNAVGGEVVADPVTIAAVIAIAAISVMIVIRLRRRNASNSAPVVEAPQIAAMSRKTRRPRPNDLIEDRFAALRLQTEELEALAPPPRHFRETDQREASYNLRRR